MANSNSDVVIIGAGWAGLSAAFHLAKHGIKSTILEASPQAGGRARGIRFGYDTVDNGQHLMIGAYHSTFEILKEIGINSEQLFYRCPLNIITSSDRHQFNLKITKKIYPFNMILSVFNIKCISLKDKLRLIRFFVKIKYNKFRINEDLSALKYLQKNNQSQKLIKYFWEPLIVAALTTNIEDASTKVFLRVLQDTFNKSATNSDLVFAKCDLSSLFVTPLLDKFKKYISVKYNSRVKSVSKVYDRFKISIQNKILSATNVIVATTAASASSILHNQFNHCKYTSKTIENLNKFTFEKIITIYYKLEKSFNYDIPMHGIINCIGQWVFNRDLLEQNNLISVVISTEKNLPIVDNITLAKQVFSELKQRFDNIPNYIDYKVIKEKRAAFKCVPNIDKIRPENKTGIDNLFLAGDYTNTGYPATLEGAVISGKNCALKIIGKK